MNLEAYFKRIGHDGPRDAGREALASVAYRHALSIPFENLDPFMGVRPSLDPEAVAEKLVTRRRGGWCFEHNLLLGDALREMGFEVRDLAARVVWGRAADAVAARTHRALQVRCDGRDLLVDVGFGGQTPTGVIEMESESEQQTPHEEFRLRRVGDERLLETRLKAGWRPMYRFDLQSQLPIDFEAPNFQLSLDPASLFVTGLRAALPGPEGRHALRDNELTWYDRQGNAQTSRLESASQIITALRDVFGINLAGLETLERRLVQAGTAVATAARS